jgi:hypothetical protein
MGNLVLSYVMISYKPLCNCVIKNTNKKTDQWNRIKYPETKCVCVCENLMYDRGQGLHNKALRN